LRGGKKRRKERGGRGPCFLSYDLEKKGKKKETGLKLLLVLHERRKGGGKRGGKGDAIRISYAPKKREGKKEKDNLLTIVHRPKGKEKKKKKGKGKCCRNSCP